MCVGVKQVVKCGIDTQYEDKCFPSHKWQTLVGI